MLTKYIIEFFVYVIGQLLSIISSVLPGFDYLSNLTSAFQTLFGVTTQVQNFAYFILGDFYFIAILLIGPALIFRFLTVPLFSFLRKIFVWGGN